MALSVKGHWPTTILNTKEPVIHAWTWEFISIGARGSHKKKKDKQSTTRKSFGLVLFLPL